MKASTIPLNNMNVNSGNIVGYTKAGEEMNSIFEEIELLLQNNESLEISARANQIDANTKPHCNLKNVDGYAQQPAVLNSINDARNVSLDFLPTCGSHEFLIPADTQVLPEEELSLYSVNQNELQPVNAPFMVPGIYKKIANAPVDANQVVCNSAAKGATNVFFAPKCVNGKIVSRTDFENCTTAGDSFEHQSSRVENYSVMEAPLDSVMDLSSNTLLKFACSIYKSAKNYRFVIDRIRNEVSRTSAVNNQKIIYRLLGPEELNLQMNCNTNFAFASQDFNRPLKVKIGRPKKQTFADIDKQASLKKQKLEKNGKEHETAKNATDFKQSLLRTRSGRIVKLVKPQLSTASVIETPTLELDHVNNLINDSKDKDFHSSPLTNYLPATTDNWSPQPHPSSPMPKRRVPPESICPKCDKIFLGRRLQRHFTQHPDHMLTKRPKQQANVESNTENMTLFRFLISKLQKPLLNEDQRADLFLNEVNDLVEQLQLRSSRLIRNTSGLHFVSARIARVLGIPEGQYALDMSAMDSETSLLDTEQNSLNGEELKRHQIIPQAVTVNPPCLDYTAISLDDTLTDEAAHKLNLSAGGKLLPPSEESLLRAVDDLVHDGITKLVGANLLQPPRTVVQSSGTSTLVPHYDHVSDNAVEALTIKENNAPQEGTPILGLSVDFFQFKNN